jgi:hypothetical protein
VAIGSPASSRQRAIRSPSCGCGSRRPSGVAAGQCDQLGEAQRFAECEQFERFELGVGEPRHAGGDQLGQRRAHRRPDRQPPQAVDLFERSARQRAQHQLADIKRVASAGLGDPPAGALFHRPADNRLGQRFSLYLSERFELEPDGAGVFP